MAEQSHSGSIEREKALQISKISDTKQAWFDYLNRMFEVNKAEADSVKVWQMVDHLWVIAKGRGVV